VVGKGRLQLETGLQWEPNDGEDSIFVPTLFRIGLSDRFELRFESNTFTRVAVGGESQSGLAPISIGAEAVLLEGEDRRPGVGVIGRFAPASGTNGFESNRMTGDVRLAADWAFAGPFSLNPNIGLGWYEGDEQTFTTGLFALTLTYAPRPNVAWFIDAGGQTAEVQGGVLSTVVDAGVAYVPRENWQFDISAGKRAFGRESAKGFVSIGIAYRHK
jgi:hypothetical protein